MPQAMYTHAERRARSAAAREADFDVRSFGCNGSMITATTTTVVMSK